MKYKLLGITGVYVSEFCFGTMTFGAERGVEAIGRVGQKEADALVHRCIDAGVNFFDTANMYAQGESEVILGRALKEKRKDVIVATKVRARMGAGPNQVGLTRLHIIEQVNESLKRLDMDHIDLYLIHGFDPIPPMEETLRALDHLVQSGKVRYIG